MIEGANDWVILTRIFIPMSAAVIATLILFAAVWHWNDWFTGLIYINDSNKWPLQTYLKQLTLTVDFSKLTREDMERLRAISGRSFKSAQIIIAMIPVLCVYPYLQKYFVKGIILGSEKG